MRQVIRKKEIIIFAIILIAAIAVWVIQNARRESVDHGSIKITVAGEDFGTYSLSNDQVIDIGGTNTCRIQKGQAKMIEASCPDHLCVHQLPIDEKGGFIICLPNQVIIEGIPAETADDANALDAVS